MIKKKNVRKIKEIFEFFLENKEDLAIEMKFKECLRLMGLETCITEILESSLFNGKSDTNGTIQDRLLHQAIRRNDRSLLMKLIEYGFLEKCTCTHETPPLFELIAKQELDWIKIFCKAGISLDNQKTIKGKPLLHFALEQNELNKKFLKKLLFYGAELSAKDSNDLTPLHYLLTKQITMSNKQKEGFAKLFLKFGANPNSCSQLINETPLHTAVRNKIPEAVQFLLLYGADVNLKTANGDTAFNQFATHYSSKSNVSDEENYICYLFVRHINWLKINCKHIDEQILRQRKIISKYKHTNIDPNFITEIEEFNVVSILLQNESKLAESCASEDLKVSTIIQERPYKCWKRILKFRLKKARQRNVLLIKCENSFTRSSGLPSVFVHGLLKLLTTTDLQCLYAACCPQSYMEKLIIEPVKLTEDSADEVSDHNLTEEESDSETSSTPEFSENESDDEVSTAELSVNEISDDTTTDESSVDESNEKISTAELPVNEINDDTTTAGFSGNKIDDETSTGEVLQDENNEETDKKSTNESEDLLLEECDNEWWSVGEDFWDEKCGKEWWSEGEDFWEDEGGDDWWSEGEDFWEDTCDNQ